MKDPLVKGHPLHALMTDVPVGALVAGTTWRVGFVAVAVLPLLGHRVLRALPQ